MTYTSGDYFGELALIQNEPRAANVYAETEVTLVTLDRHSFKRLLGPLTSIMKRKIDEYRKNSFVMPKSGLSTNSLAKIAQSIAKGPEVIFVLGGPGAGKGT
jgi:cAMP-dependent protein kinase regulator